MEGDLVLELAASLARQGQRVAVLALSRAAAAAAGARWIAAPRDAAGYAHDLYASLRRLDEAGCDTILVEQPPQDAGVGGDQRPAGACRGGLCRAGRYLKGSIARFEH